MRVGAVDRAQRLARGAESKVAGPRLRVMCSRALKSETAIRGAMERVGRSFAEKV